MLALAGHAGRPVTALHLVRGLGYPPAPLRILASVSSSRKVLRFCSSSSSIPYSIEPGVSSVSRRRSETILAMMIASYLFSITTTVSVIYCYLLLMVPLQAAFNHTETLAVSKFILKVMVGN